LKSYKLTVGLCTVVHGNMPGNEAQVIDRAVKSLENLKETLNFDLVVMNEQLKSEESGEKARKWLEDHNVDFTLVLNASLGYGRTILPLARVNSLLGLWSVPEPTRTGILQLNSICGLNLYGAVISNYLNQYDIPFKWFYGYPDSNLFLERFKVTLKALQAIKALKNSRIAQIGDIADGFENFNYDERLLEKKFGTTINRRHDVEDVVKLAEACSQSDITLELTEIMKEGTCCERVSKTDMEKFARVNIALRTFATENAYDALAVNCWPKFQQVYDFAVCSSLSRLNNSGIVASCEGDVIGALNMLVYNAMTGESSTMSDLSALDEKDDSLCMWHCGPTAGSFADKNGVKWDAHFNIGSYCNGKWCGKGVVADLNFKPGKVTISRFDSSFDRMFVMTGEVLSDKKGFDGSSGWIGNLKVDGQKMKIADYINTLIVNHVDHHHQIAYGDLTNELYEFANWKKIKIEGLLPYKPYMQY
jgi:L-fucose isomerase-like protein